VITEPEFKDWLDHPVTRRVKSMLEKKQIGIMKAWAAGNLTAAEGDATLQMNAKAIGQCDSIDFVLNLDFETYEAEIDDGERKQVTPAGARDFDQGSGSE